MKRICKNCTFFQPGAEKGQCRLMPPTVCFSNGQVITSWPAVTEKEFCGQFKLDDEVTE